MSQEEEFGPLSPRPHNWDEVFSITGGLKDVPIALIERGRVDWKYEFSSTDMRQCGREGCKQEHAHGFVVAIRGRRYVNIGKDCAQKYAHAELWAGKVNSYNARVSDDARSAAILTARDEAQRKQHWLDNTPEIDLAIALHESFVREARGPLYAEIEKRAEKGLTRIERDVRLTDEQREARRIMLSGAEWKDTPAPYVAAVEQIHVADLVGLSCFRPMQGPRDRRNRLQRHLETLLKWIPANGDMDDTRALTEATREIGPLSNELNSSIVATQKFFSAANLRAVMRLEVIARQGILAIERDGPDKVSILRRPHWNRAA